MKNEEGFDLKGNAEILEEVKTHLELLISKFQERLKDEEFTLPYSCISLFADHEVTQQISKIERKHCVEFRVFNNYSVQESMNVSEFSLHVSTQSVKDASHQDTLVSAKQEDCQTQLTLQVHGFKENLKQAIVALKTIFH